MKKTILRLMFAVCIATSFVSCNSNDDNNEFNISDAKHFNPPTWTQGKWGYQYDSNDEYKLEFTTNDFILKNGNTTSSQSDLINFFNAAGGSSRVIEEIKTDTRYKFSIVNEFGTERDYDLQLQSDGAMYDLKDDAFGYYYKRN